MMTTTDIAIVNWVVLIYINPITLVDLQVRVAIPATLLRAIAPKQINWDSGRYAGIAVVTHWLIQIAATATKAHGTHSSVKGCIDVELGVDKCRSGQLILEITALMGLCEQ
jgi:hypothetical protein